MHVSWLLRRDTLEAFVHKLSQMRSLSLTEHVIFFSLFLLSLTASLSSQDFPHPFSWNTVAVFSLMKNSSSFLFFISQPLSQTRIIFSLVSFLLPLSSYTYSQKKRLYLCPHLSPLSLPHAWRNRRQRQRVVHVTWLQWQNQQTVTGPTGAERLLWVKRLIWTARMLQIFWHKSDAVHVMLPAAHITRQMDHLDSRYRVARPRKELCGG